jgi:general stress protein YciG
MATQENTSPGKGQTAKDRQPPRQGQDNDQSGSNSGSKDSGSKDKSGNRGNFANDPDRAREAGQKGGHSR